MDKDEFELRPVLDSVKRLEEACRHYQETHDRIWTGFIKRETTILLRRVFGLWRRVRSRRGQLWT